MSQPIAGTTAEAYLRNRGITALRGTESLRIHPRCYYRADPHSATEIWPALIAAVTDLDGRITGVHQTWLDPSGAGKAPTDTPRRAMGHLLGHAVRFGVARDILAAGEGIKTMLSLRMAVPFMPMVAALSANHLAALLFPPALRRLYIARDADPAGDGAVERLVDRAHEAGIEAIVLSPTFADFNDDLRYLGIDHLRAAVRILLAPEDVARFMVGTGAGTGEAIRTARRAPHRVAVKLPLPERPRRGPGEGRGRSDGRRAGSATAASRFLPLPAPLQHERHGGRRHSSRDKKASEPPSSAALRPLSLRLGGAGPARPPPGDRPKAAMGAAQRQGTSP